MSRVLRLSSAFFRACRRHGVVPGTPPAQRIAATIRALSRSPELPAASDLEFLMPRALAGYLRDVPGTGYAVAFTMSEDELVILTLRVR